ncbi:peptide deformylase, mitochondrial-like [Chrysoperla carnea]|uniref:peptide deformylase, mitochondrial-like n=1 Tax=Chrysoperla carnea TaxID=189513 RepID=UPI001D06E0DA|nr:peptide deformylase, mitochondrial-like [Chrysoperla carnea]
MFNTSKVLPILPLKSNLKTQIRNISFRKVSAWYRNWFYSKTTPPYSHIVQIGDPILRVKAENVPDSLIHTTELKNLIKQLQYVMKKYNSIGISAPQIGVPLRIFLMELNHKNLERFPKDVRKTRQIEHIPFTVFINPVLRVLDYKKATFPEACESFRGYTADVPRHISVQCSGLNELGKKVSLNSQGWTARVIQHEMDHLDGKMYTDLMDRPSLSCSCWQAVNAHSGRISIPFAP